MTDIPHFDFPFRFVGGKAAEVEQDTVDDVAACINVALLTIRGTRLALPDFGIDDPAFLQGGVSTDELLSQVQRYEPRLLQAIEEGWDFDSWTQNLRYTITDEGRQTSG